MSKKNVSTSQTLKIDEIFNNNGWKVDGNNGIFLYNNYIKRLSSLPEDTKELFLDLTQRFENIESISQINMLFRKAYKKIDKNIIDNSRKIYFLPLIIPILGYENKSRFKFVNWILKQIGYNKKIYTERPETKSCDTMITLFQIEYRDMYGHSKFVFPKKYSEFKKQYKKTQDIIILIDDFIGSGDTASDVLEFYLKEEKYNSDKIKLLSLISMEQGIDFIKGNHNVAILSGIIKNKSISNYYGEEVSSKMQTVIKMSKSLNIKSDFFGYKDSEALVSILNKSPNNTLPIFWYETKSNPAPFPRRKIYNY